LGANTPLMVCPNGHKYTKIQAFTRDLGEKVVFRTYFLCEQCGMEFHHDVRMDVPGEVASEGQKPVITDDFHSSRVEDTEEDA